MLKYRTTKKNDRFGQFAEEVYKDHGFPKYSHDYYEISNYLELGDTSLQSVTIFDELWSVYEIEVLE